MFSLGDIIGQGVEIILYRPSPFDWKRCGRAFVFGSAILGPLAHVHYNFLHWLVVTRWGVTGARMPLVKVFLEQFTYWAPAILSIYLLSISLMEGKNATESVEVLKQRLWPTLKANWILWPAAQIVNFAFIPVPHQLNFVLMVSLLWAAYLSIAGGQSKKTQSVNSK